MNTEPNITVELVTSDTSYNDAMSIRRNVFVEEMGISETEEFDGNDHCAAQIIAYFQDGRHKKAVGTMRIRFFADFAKFERMAVIKDFRKSNVSDSIMRYGFNYVSEKGYREVHGLCKKELLPRWQKCGYQIIDGARPIYQAGMTLIPISRQLEENPQAINITSPAELLIGLEGHWFDSKNPSATSNYQLKTSSRQK